MSARITTCLVAAVLLTACGGEMRPSHELTGTTMGTTFSVKIVAPPRPLQLESLRDEIRVLLEAVNQRMSTYIEDSEISLFNSSPGDEWVPVSAELCASIEDAQAISRLSGGAFDVTVAPLVDAWGFGPAIAVDTPPDDATIRALLADTGYGYLDADCSIPALRKRGSGVRVDLSAWAKGYAVDRIAGLLASHNVSDYLVEIGGELRGHGLNARREPWSIAIETPRTAGRSVHKVVRLTDFAMATSGDYRNYFEHDGRMYSHTIDPRTGHPVAHEAASVTVVADSAAFADGIATALLVLGPDAGLALAEREEIAAFFLLRLGDGFEERVTTSFAKRVSGI